MRSEKCVGGQNQENKLLEEKNGLKILLQDFVLKSER